MGDQLFTQHYTSGPPALPFNQGGDVDTIAIEKQEEWIKKRKVEQVTTKQIETRVKRQIMVTEDGTVVEDSGPQVTTNTSEDTETKREEHTEKKGGDDEGTVAIPDGWVAVPGAVIVREKHEKKSNTRDETDERLETEEIHHLGPLTNEELEDALENKAETGELVVFRRRSSGDSTEQQVVPYSSGKRIVHQSRKHKRIIDQENTEERSEEKDGKITTETTKHEHHEVVDDEELPDKDDARHSDTSSIHEVVKETRNNYTTAKDEDQVEYFAVPKGGDALSSGVKLGRGPRHSTQQIVQYDEFGVPNPIAAIPSITQPTPIAKPAVEVPLAERTDALTKQPLDLEAEEETRKLETSRWLDSHFGSESSYESTEGGEKKSKKKMPVSQQVSSGGINVTMTSDPISSDRYEAPSIPAPPPPPPPALEPLATSRIYATTGNSASVTNRMSEIKTSSSTPRYASPNERVQVLPVGPEKVFTRNMVGSSPQPPTYLTNQHNNSSSGYQSSQQYRNLSSEVSNNNSVTVKRAASFNPTPNKPWMNNNVARDEPRQSFLSSMNNNNSTSDYARPEPANVYARPTVAPAYAAPIIRRWPPTPNKSIDEEDDIRTSTPVYQQPQKTVIRLGPESYSSPMQKTSVGINRTQSMFSPSGNIRQQPQPMSNNNRMNIINSSLQSVPERDRIQPKSGYDKQQQSGTFFIDVERSFSKLAPTPSTNNEKPKTSQSFYGKTPPPRPAPPTHYGTLGRTSESFRYPKSPPMFSSDLDTPPVRPVRRNKSKKMTIKADSGTQTAVSNNRNPALDNHLKGLEMFSRTLDRPTGKPIKQYYMGEDPFNANKQRSSVSPIRTVLNGHATEPVQQSRKPVDITRSQTLPRQPSKPFAPVRATESPPRNYISSSNLNSSRNLYSQNDRSVNNNSYGQPSSMGQPKIVSQKRSPSPPSLLNPNKSGITGSVVNRSQSFHAENQARRLNQIQTSVGPSRLSNATTSLNRLNLTSPLYKSTSFLNRLNTSNDQVGTLKSPGIVTSISKSQLDLTNSNNVHSSSALYTLPRRKSPARNLSPIDITPPQPVGTTTMQTGVNERLAPLSPSSDPPRGESYSSMHRRKMQAASAGGLSPEVKTDQELNGQLSFQASTKAPNRMYQPQQPANQPIQEELEPEAKSLKDRIAMLETAGIQYGSVSSQTLPRVVSGKTKAPPPPPPPRVSSALSKKPTDRNETGELKKEQFLQGLRNTAPELFMHIHGDENLKDTRVKREDVIDGQGFSRAPRTPSPPPPVFNNRVFTSTPTNKNLNKSTMDGPPSGRGLMTPPPPLFSAHSPFGSQHDLALRRGSLNSNGSGSIIPAVRIPPPVNYSETVRIKSNQDPDSQSDSVQSYSKRVQPYVDGFSSETKQSSQQTTLTRSQYSLTGSNHALPDLSPSSPFQIRPQQSGGVIISVRGNGE